MYWQTHNNCIILVLALVTKWTITLLYQPLRWLCVSAPCSHIPCMTDKLSICLDGWLCRWTCDFWSSVLQSCSAWANTCFSALPISLCQWFMLVDIHLCLVYGRWSIWYGEIVTVTHSMCHQTLNASCWQWVTKLLVVPNNATCPCTVMLLCPIESSHDQHLTWGNLAYALGFDRSLRVFGHWSLFWNWFGDY